jgi:hypothetical protein
MSDSVQCQKCFTSAKELRSEGELGDSLLVGTIGYCLDCCPDEKLIEAAELIHQVRHEQ